MPGEYIQKLFFLECKFACVTAIHCTMPHDSEFSHALCQGGSADHAPPRKFERNGAI